MAEAPNRIIGLAEVIPAVAFLAFTLWYLLRTLNGTYTVSYVRYFFVFLVGTLLFSPLVYYAGLSSGKIGEALKNGWTPLILVSLCCGVFVCASGLLLASSKGRGGVMTRCARKFLKCKEIPATYGKQ
jgi:hypothetical protein